MYDTVIIPFVRKFTGHGDSLAVKNRYTIGIVLVISKFSMVAVGVPEMIQLENVRRNEYYDLETILMSIILQVPQYFLIVYARVVTSIGDWSGRVLL